VGKGRAGSLEEQTPILASLGVVCSSSKNGWEREMEIFCELEQATPKLP